jgi:hypothetical protein
MTNTKHFGAITADGRVLCVTPIREVAAHYANMAVFDHGGFGTVELMQEVERGVYRRTHICEVPND